MSFDWVSIIKSSAGLFLKPLHNFLRDKYARYKASDRVMAGEDLASQASLHSLVKVELNKLADSNKLPPGFQSDEFRDWLRHGVNIEIFIEALITKSGKFTDMSRRAEDKLRAKYGLSTTKDRQPTSGQVKYAISYVYGQLSATETSRQKLQLALQQWIAGRAIKHKYPEQPKFPKEADFARVKAMATALVEAGMNRWRVPKFTAPLTLEIHTQKDANKPQPIDASELLPSIEAGDSFFLFGAGGIGKTTFLLDLCKSFLNRGHRIPLYVDVAVWARKNISLFDYLSSLPAARANEVTSAELIKLAESGRLAIMLNGWNEMGGASKLTCTDEIIQFTSAVKALSFVVAFRTLSEGPNIPNAKPIEIRGLTWQRQSTVIRSELSSEEAAPLFDLLAKNLHLRHAARIPLILRGLVASAKMGAVAKSSVFELLGAIVQAYEKDDQRHLVLSEAPVDGHQLAYLEELACSLTSQHITNFPKSAALEAIHSASTRLAKRGQIGILPSPTAILDVLVSHHLLHLDDGFVRFAHQRFQEYFAAIRLLHVCTDDDLPTAHLDIAVSQPAWHESLLLVAGRLEGEGILAAARTRLVKAAAAVDLGLACDLTGICGFNSTDNTKFHTYLVSRINEMASSSLNEVRELGIAYQIASRLPVFAEKLWSLLESEDSQNRFQTYRMNSPGISLAQFGTGAFKRVASWATEKQCEFMHEIAENEDNYEFLVDIARNGSNPKVQAAAISALFWNYPASGISFEAWLEASTEVQTEYIVVRDILYALEEGDAPDIVLKRLQTIDVNDLSNKVKLLFAFAFPNEVGPQVLDFVFEYLRNVDRHGKVATLITIAQTNDPERLMGLVQELALQLKIVPDWVGEYLLEAPVNFKKNIFEQAWPMLLGQGYKSFNSKIFGPIASSNHIEQSVSIILKYNETTYGQQNDEWGRYRQLEGLLENVPGDDLLNVVTQLGQVSSYDQVELLLDLVLRRMGGGGGGAIMANHWLPTVDKVRQLVALFVDKVEAAEVPQDAVRLKLCSIASHVAPAEFGSLLLETCRRHLDAWHLYRQKIHQWSRGTTSSRPHNPQYGFYLSAALTKWGIDSLPGLLELMSHPSAMEFIPEAIARVVSLPWASKRGSLFNTINTDIQEGEQHRRLGLTFRQPDEASQHWTDEAAKVLGQRLDELVTTYLEKRSSDEKWNPREAENRLRRLASIVARIPSSCVIEPVNLALASGLMDVHGMVDALRGLVRQGERISNPAIVGQLEDLYEQAAHAKRYNDSLRYAMSDASELLLCVTHISLLSKPIEHYLQQWRRFSNPYEIIRRLGAMQSDAAWPALLKMGKYVDEKGQQGEEYTRALVCALTPRHFSDFLGMITSRGLFSWCRREWTFEQLAPNIAAVLDVLPDQTEVFVETCLKAHSCLADRLAGEVLSHIKRLEKVRQSYLLESLDAGRAVYPHMPTYKMLGALFTHKEPIKKAGYEVTPKANNDLRKELYARAKGSGPIADGCKRVLASLECGRRERGRPNDEPRHPDPEDSMAWSDIFGVRQ